MARFNDDIKQAAKVAAKSYLIVIGCVLAFLVFLAAIILIVSLLATL
ncbi:MAG: hypothetical protein J6Y65_03325 [Eggerthellaceae bacterium]|nr:hypothetical protein [Eggerthellaceae bacterium]